MAWAVRGSTMLGPLLVTNEWPDLLRLPQPVFHRDELVQLAAVNATPERYKDVIAVKRCFRGAWVVRASRARRQRRVRNPIRRIAGRGIIGLPPAEDDE